MKNADSDLSLRFPSGKTRIQALPRLHRMTLTIGSQLSLAYDHPFEGLEEDYLFERAILMIAAADVPWPPLLRLVRFRDAKTSVLAANLGREPSEVCFVDPGARSPCETPPPLHANHVAKQKQGLSLVALD